MQVSKSELKAKMLAYFREVQRSGQPLVVTDRGRAVLKVIPIAPQRAVADVFGPFQGRVVYGEDPLLPTTDEWDEV